MSDFGCQTGVFLTTHEEEIGGAEVLPPDQLVPSLVDDPSPVATGILAQRRKLRIPLGIPVKVTRLTVSFLLADMTGFLASQDASSESRQNIFHRESKSAYWTADRFRPRVVRLIQTHASIRASMNPEFCTLGKTMRLDRKNLPAQSQRLLSHQHSQKGKAHEEEAVFEVPGFIS